MPDNPPRPWVHPDDLLISSDVRQQCGGITRHTLIRWRAARGFPDPISARPTGGGQVIEIWDQRDVRAWLEANPAPIEREKAPGDRGLSATRDRRGG